jgi:hypothetical protein
MTARRADVCSGFRLSSNARPSSAARRAVIDSPQPQFVFVKEIASEFPPPADSGAAVSASPFAAAQAPAIAGASREGLLVWLFTATIFLNAGLLFLVQPMFSKMVLPLLGGSPAVWNTCMLFFQTTLLAGYLYAHLGPRWLGVGRHAALHLVLLGLSLLLLPLAVGAGWQPPAEGSPVPWLLLLLTVSIGIPFFLLSAGSPLLQKWFAGTAHPDAHNPYFLYAASNLGSMLALLAYPLLLEPRLRLPEQSLVWTGGYWVLVSFAAACALLLWRAPAGSGRTATETVTPATPGQASEPIALRRKLRWIALAFVPSSLLLGVTTFVTTDIAAAPLLWVIPLALYLLSFVLVFARCSWLPHAWMVRAQPFLVLPLIVLMFVGLQVWPTALLPWHLAAFFVVAMVCHGELARSRPAAKHLTEFYLWLSVGGALGGAFNVLVAPVIFSTVAEYPLALVLALLLRPYGLRNDVTAMRNAEFGMRNDGTELRNADFGMRNEPESPDSEPDEAARAANESGATTAPGSPSTAARRPRSVALRQRALDIVLPAALGLGVLASLWFGLASSTLAMGIIGAVGGLICFSFSERPVRFGLGAAALLLAGAVARPGVAETLLTERSFFGVHRVKLDQERGYHVLSHGSTIHGAQSLDPERRTEPLTYYNPEGPVGQLFAGWPAADGGRRVAAVGLGAGSVLCYGRPGDRWTFFEIDPLVERIARDPRYFSFLSACPVGAEVVLGDARLTLAQAPTASFDLILLDAFSSDAIPLHLLTREALAMYLQKLAPGGVIAVHISNRHLELEPVVARLARDAELVALRQFHRLDEEQRARMWTPSRWVLLARRSADLGELAADERWSPPLERFGVHVWTDDFSDIVSVMKWR